MADQIILFKRGVKSVLEERLVGDAKPLSGEPVFESDTGKFKIGNGTNDYADLPYIGEEAGSQEIYYTGYYLNGKFYEDSTYQTELPLNNQRIYVDLNSYMFYKYYGAAVGFKPTVGQATDVVPGMVKLYNTHGQNTDGTMSQKTITDGVNAIKFTIEQTPDEDGDNVPENVLVLDLP